MLGVRWHGETELRRKLQRKKFEAPVIDEVLVRLRAQNLLDDDRFAEAYAKSRLRSAFGSRRIAQELGQRGVAEGTRRSAIAAAVIEEPEEARLHAACRKRLAQILGRGKQPDGRDLRQKLASHLIRKGFRQSEVFEVVTSELKLAAVPVDDDVE
jgi:regulatory protein